MQSILSRTSIPNRSLKSCFRVTPVHVHQEPTWSARAHTNYSAFDRLRRNQIGVKKLPLEIVITLSNGSRGER